MTGQMLARIFTHRCWQMSEERPVNYFSILHLKFWNLMANACTMYCFFNANLKLREHILCVDKLNTDNLLITQTSTIIFTIQRDNFKNSNLPQQINWYAQDCDTKIETEFEINFRCYEASDSRWQNGNAPSTFR